MNPEDIRPYVQKPQHNHTNFDVFKLIHIRTEYLKRLCFQMQKKKFCTPYPTYLSPTENRVFSALNISGTKPKNY